jgi:hypothetical protein
MTEDKQAGSPARFAAALETLRASGAAFDEAAAARTSAWLQSIAAGEVVSEQDEDAGLDFLIDSGLSLDHVLHGRDGAPFRHTR